jgi:hypothetical protein
MTWGKVPAAKRIDIYNSEVGDKVRQKLESLQSDPGYITEESYTADVERYPGGVMPFVERHLLYLHQHPAVDPAHYLSNLRLKLKIRS